MSSSQMFVKKSLDISKTGSYFYESVVGKVFKQI
jgi:hypothetical protein